MQPPNSTSHVRSPSRTVVDVHGVPLSGDLENEWGLAPLEQTDVVSKNPLQPLPVELLQRPIEFTRHTLIAVMHEAGEGVVAAGMDGLLERVEDEVRPHRGRHAPADEAPREHVDDEGDEDEATPRRDEREVRQPQLIRPRRHKPAIDQVARPRPLAGVGRRDPGAPAHGAPQTHVAHQTPHGAACDADSLALPASGCAAD